MTTNSFNFGDTVTTSVTTTNPSVFAGMDTQTLLDYWAEMDRKEAAYRDMRQRIEFELQKQMKAEGATAIAHETLTCKLEYPSPDYDLGKLNGLREILPPDVIRPAFTPAHQQTVQVPEKWDMRKVKPLAQYGTAAAQLIQDAAIPKTPKLVIKRKEKEPNA